MTDISVVIPAHDEVAAIAGLLEEVGRVLDGHAFEVIVVDDGSLDGTDRVLRTLAEDRGWLKVQRNPVRAGQSASIRLGVRAATAPLVVTLDGDGQNPPDQIPVLLAPFERLGAESLGLVQGQRVDRRDGLAKRWGSHLANAIRGWLLRDGIRDSGCGLKAFRREAYLELPWFDHIHRFMPAMMLREGWRVETVPVSHRERIGGRSKYTNVGRALVGIPDLFGAAWLIRRAGPPRREEHPLRGEDPPAAASPAEGASLPAPAGSLPDTQGRGSPPVALPSSIAGASGLPTADPGPDTPAPGGENGQEAGRFLRAE